ncbi:hypothetical protein FSARC_4945 [Fusarium sarcochroum]|uniref:Uncharacterized protein n=1 Tax=Fusarium sarcochroum TaxID=1208366 RepID=A0A8H4U0J1_9HYPO|nr:hypothetical protein FSARC_4945 [Fusarium sarcochroum]
MVPKWWPNPCQIPGSWLHWLGNAPATPVPLSRRSLALTGWCSEALGLTWHSPSLLNFPFPFLFPLTRFASLPVLLSSPPIPISLSSPLSTKQATTSGHSFVPVPLSPPHTFKAFVLASPFGAYCGHQQAFVSFPSSSPFRSDSRRLDLLCSTASSVPRLDTYHRNSLSSHHQSTDLLDQAIEHNHWPRFTFNKGYESPALADDFDLPAGGSARHYT